MKPFEKGDRAPELYAGELVAQLALVWGLVALYPGSRMFGSSPTYGEFAQIAPQQVWGAVTVSLAVLKLTGLYLHRPVMSWLAALGFCAWWAFGAWCFLRSTLYNPAGWSYLLLLAWQLRIYAREAHRAPNVWRVVRQWRARYGVDHAP